MTGKDKDREDRLAEALRENLRRRKAQARELIEQPHREGDGNRDRDDHS